MATASPADRVRRKLRELGKRRSQAERTDAQLTRDIQKALAEADGKISVSEQAKLLKLHRTTLYRVYK